MGKVLVIGVDPAAVPGLDVAAIEAALQRGQARFDELGIEAELCTVAIDEHAGRRIIEALEREEYACVVIGGGIRKPEPLLEFFEQVVNLVRRHAPGAAIAFNTSPADSADAALRWLG